MSNINIEICPETGICSIIKSRAAKIDLTSPEVDAIRAADGDVDTIKAIIGEGDYGFAKSLSADEIEDIACKIGE